jgi:hypothetical protein
MVKRRPAIVLQQCRDGAETMSRHGPSCSVGAVRCARRGSPNRAA